MSTPAKLVQLISGLIYATDFTDGSDWQLGANYSIDTSRPCYLCHPSPILMLSGSTTSTDIDYQGCREPKVTVDIDGALVLAYNACNSTSWASAEAISTDAGLTWTKTGAIAYTGLSSNPNSLLSATQGEFRFQFSGTWYWYSVAPDALTSGIPGGLYHSIILTSTATLLRGAIWAYQSETPALGGSGTFNQQVNDIGLVLPLNDGSGNWEAYLSCRTSATTGVAWTLARATASGPNGPFTNDGDQGTVLSSYINTATGVRPENVMVWSTEFSRWALLVNSVNAAGSGNDGLDAVYAYTDNTWGDPTNASLTDAFNEGSLAAQWTQYQTGTYAATLTGSALSLGAYSAANLTGVYDLGYQAINSQQTATFTFGDNNSGIGFSFRQQSSGARYAAIITAGAVSVCNLAIYNWATLTGAPTLLGSAQYPSSAIATGTPVTLTIKLVGQTFTLLNSGGSTLATYTDSANTYTASGGVGIMNGDGGSGTRLVSNYTATSLDASGTTAYRTRVLSQTAASDTAGVGNGINVGYPYTNPDGSVVRDAAGRIPITYARDQPGGTGIASFLGFKIGQAILTPSRGSLLCTKPSAVTSHSNKSLYNTSAVHEFTIAAESAGTNGEYHYRATYSTSAATSGYVVAYDSTHVYLYKVVAGSYGSPLVTANRPSFPTTPDQYNSYLEKVRIVVVGNTHNVYWQSDPGTPLITYTDSSSPIASGPQVGFGSGNTGTVRHRGLAIYSSESISFTGLPASTVVGIKCGSTVMNTGTSDGSGNLAIKSSHYPITSVVISGVGEVFPTSNIFGGSTLVYVPASGGGGGGGGGTNSIPYFEV